MKNQPNKATVKDGLPSPKELPIPKPIGDFILGKEYGMCPNGALYHYSDVCELLQSYSDQQNAELREQNRKNQSRWAKDRVAQDKKHDADMMEACGKIVDLEERVKELEGLLAIWVKQNNYLRRHSISDFDDIHNQTKKALKK